MSRSRVYQIRVTLKRSKPPIWRKLAVPSDMVLGELHEVIQIAMGWTNSHLHQFVLKDKSLRKGPEALARLIQEARWDETFAASQGMRVFVPRGPEFAGLDMDGEDEEAVTLGEVCPKVKSKLIYEYDFGDDWEHTIEVQKIFEPEPGVEYPVCLGGRKACPPEDCGGIWGYYQLLETIADPDADDHDDMAEWLGGGFDPDFFDLEEVNAVLAGWRGAGRT
ncbi:MAG: plasmid pRiA4b ORF-3 family protein [Planctomycetota bacterium]